MFRTLKVLFKYLLAIFVKLDLEGGDIEQTGLLRKKLEQHSLLLAL